MIKKILAGVVAFALLSGMWFLIGYCLITPDDTFYGKDGVFTKQTQELRQRMYGQEEGPQEILLPSSMPTHRPVSLPLEEVSSNFSHREVNDPLIKR